MKSEADDMAIYDAVKANYVEVSRALKHIEIAINTSIRNKNDAATIALTRVQMLLVSVKAEAALTQILYVPNGIPPAIRKVLLAQENALERWRDTVDACFRLHYKIRPRVDLTQALDHDVLARRATLHELIDSELSLLISMRNKLAHGQFVKPLNMTLDSVESVILGKMIKENSLTLKYRDNLLEQLASALKDLVESPITFERLFNKRYRSIRDNRAALPIAKYSEWVLRVRSTHVPFSELVQKYTDKLNEKS